MTIRIQRAFACAAVILSVAWSPTVRADNRSPDFDNDNLDDLAVSAYLETIGGVSQAGVVHVLYGTSSGLDDKSGRHTTLWRGLTGVEEDPGVNEGFGQSLAWGDFDGDCFDDLTVGVGADLQVFYGSSTGLSTVDDEVFSGLGSFGPGAQAQAAGDFNGDGFDDLAINTFLDEVTVLYGSATGLDVLAGPGLQIWDHEALDVEEFSENSEEFFGHSLATGDFNCDGIEDLAIGSPFEHTDLMNPDAEGAVYVLYGSVANGLSTKFQVWHQGQPNIEGTPEDGDAFGWSLATGNFNNDSANGFACLDLAIGVPGEVVGATGHDHGAVAVIYGGSANGLQATSPANKLWTQGLNGNIEGTPTDDAQFGRSLVAGKMDGDGFEDLAIGASGLGLGGAVAIIRGGSSGLVETDDVLWNQASTNVPENDVSGDNFGWCLAYGREWHTNFDHGLAVCAPWKDTASGVQNVGSLAVLYLNGVSSPAVSSSSVSWDQTGFGETRDAGDQFSEITLPSRDRPFTTLDCD